MKTFTLVIINMVVATTFASAQDSKKGMRGSFISFVMNLEKPGEEPNINTVYDFFGLPVKSYTSKGHVSVMRFLETATKSRFEVAGTILQADCEKRIVSYVGADAKVDECPMPRDFKSASTAPILFPIPDSVQSLLRKLPEREKIAGHWCDAYEAKVGTIYGKVWKLADHPEITMKVIAQIGSIIYVLQATTFEQDVEISDTEFALPASATKKP